MPEIAIETTKACTLARKNGGLSCGVLSVRCTSAICQCLPLLFHKTRPVPGLPQASYSSDLCPTHRTQCLASAPQQRTPPASQRGALPGHWRAFAPSHQLPARPEQLDERRNTAVAPVEAGLLLFSSGFVYCRLCTLAQDSRKFALHGSLRAQISQHCRAQSASLFRGQHARCIQGLGGRLADFLMSSGCRCFQLLNDRMFKPEHYSL